MCQQAKMKVLQAILFTLLLTISVAGLAQTGRDTLAVRTDSTTSTKNPALTKDTGIVITRAGDTLKVVPKHDPRKATLRSLILPGWGQAYNKRYWEIPIVYGALGITAAIYLYNDKWYKRCRNAYDIKVNADTGRFTQIDPKLQPLSTNSLQVYRNAFRRDRDYSALWFVVFWGLNVLDATVFAHLKDFDVSEDLSLQVNPVITNNSKGVSLALSFKSPDSQKRRHYLP